MADVKCALCGWTHQSYQIRPSMTPWLCAACSKLLPTNTTEYVPEEKEVEMPGTGSENPIVRVSAYGGPIQQVAGDVWRVKSESAEKWYTVDLAVPKCDCTNWATQRNKLVSQARAQDQPDSSVSYRCKHCNAALQAARDTGNDRAENERRATAEKTAKIKAEFTANKTKEDALDMLRELGEL